MANSLTIDSDQYSCDVQRGCAVLRFKAGAHDVLRSPQARDDLLSSIERIAAADDVRGLVHIKSRDYATDEAANDLLTRITSHESAAYVAELALRYELMSASITVGLMRYPKPLVAGLIGPTTAEYLGIALASDFRFASPDTEITFPNLDFGLPPGGALSFFLGRYIGIAKASELYFSDQPLSAEAAKELGLITDIVPTDSLEQRCIEQIERMNKLKPIAVETTKRLFNEPLVAEFEQHSNHNQDLIAYAMNKVSGGA